LNQFATCTNQNVIINFTQFFVLLNFRIQYQHKPKVQGQQRSKMKRSSQVSGLDEGKETKELPIKIYICAGRTIFDMTDFLTNHSGMMRDGYLCSVDAKSCRVCVHSDSITHTDDPETCFTYDRFVCGFMELETAIDIMKGKNFNMKDLKDLDIPIIFEFFDYLVIDKNIIDDFSSKARAIILGAFLRNDVSSTYLHLLTRTLIRLLEKSTDVCAVKDFGFIIRSRHHIDSDYLRSEFMGILTSRGHHDPITETNHDYITQTKDVYEAHVAIRHLIAMTCMEDIGVYGQISKTRIAMIHEIACDEYTFYFDTESNATYFSDLECPSSMFTFLAKDKVIIAGGAALKRHPLVRSWITHIPGSDVDFFLLKNSTQHETATKMATELVNTHGYSMTLLGSSVLCFRHVCWITVQLIFSGCSTTEKLLDTFDLTATKVALDGERLICPFATNKQLFDRAIPKGSFSPLTGPRIQKMVDKGFQISPALQTVLTAYKSAGINETKSTETDLKICDIMSSHPEKRMQILKVADYMSLNPSVKQELCCVEDIDRIVDDKVLTVDQVELDFFNRGYHPILTLENIRIPRFISNLFLPLKSDYVFKLPMSWSVFTASKMSRIQVVDPSDYFKFCELRKKVFEKFGADEEQMLQNEKFQNIAVKTDLNTELYINGVQDALFNIPGSGLMYRSSSIPDPALMYVTASVYGISVGSSIDTGKYIYELLFMAQVIHCITDA
jgi:hypothetical protein